jgi:hypothetical protein
MREYFLQHGTYRAEDVARLLGERAGTPGAVEQEAKPTTIELLQRMANQRK